MRAQPIHSAPHLHPSRRSPPPAAGLLATAALVAALVAWPSPAAAAPTGLVCTTGAAGTPTFSLTAKAGYVNLPDGNTMYMWSYASGSGAFQHPGPVLCVNEGDVVTVVLQNALGEAASIMFPGQEGVLANGAPAQPQGTGAGLSLTNTAAPGGSVTYTFTASRPGVFIYESGTNPSKQVRMGLFGALVVRPTAAPAPGSPLPALLASDRPDSRFTASEEFLVLLSEIDPYQHTAAAARRNFNLANYRPRYWLINGRGFPDSIADNAAPWLASQPYGALATIQPLHATNHPDPGRILYLNVGTEDFPYHPHGNNGRIIGRDGHPVAAPDTSVPPVPGLGADHSFEKFAVNVGPGQTWDVLFSWYDREGYSLANPVPTTVPDIANLVVGPFYGGSPYLGEQQPLPPGTSTLNECGEYYIISHNHALFQITSWGLVMSGPVTYARIDPPGGCPTTP